mmetsp:Transcript_16598/g.31169  ORF Transcript_16598/g.31169 Transcript_16598/m.31169 type:complete len:123 (-) Transcript_16598:180-548(-)|eukprot:CAMPEP_0197452036 /NCGR_PEP_ID=MMETSP1175-20131217/30894_1 /TAXON_ID=1003142 /ORGANISM="Triceratium dubium, Strain CCMP147" /LENGTH=122 /DNA_ID=CAMNT_0042984925 /DNA_START=121 /DNA_END=489 /DNA_ORIENTATION=+
MRLAPPKYVKEAVVRNNTRRTATVTVKFGSAAQESEGNGFLEDERRIEPDESVTFESRTYDMGTWTAVAPVYSVRAITPGDGGDDVVHALHTVKADRLIGRQTFILVDDGGEVTIELGETLE